jgi:hypothetical protein
VLKDLFKLLDRSMGPYEADLTVDHQGGREQNVHGDNPTDFSNVFDGGSNAHPCNGRFHVGFQLPAFGAAGA